MAGKRLKKLQLLAKLRLFVPQPLSRRVADDDEELGGQLTYYEYEGLSWNEPINSLPFLAEALNTDFEELAKYLAYLERTVCMQRQTNKLLLSIVEKDGIPATSAMVFHADEDEDSRRRWMEAHNEMCGVTKHHIPKQYRSRKRDRSKWA